VQALRMMHPEVQDEIEIVLCDNAPDDPQGQALSKYVAGWIKNGRYVRANEIQGTAFPREQVFQQARGEWVLCMDSHVMLPVGTLRRFIDWAKEQGETPDLFQGPMVLDDLGTGNMATHFSDAWGAGMWGQWGTDPRGLDIDAEPFEIQMMGLGLFSCRKKAWQHFNRRFAGFGGEEGYIHEKFRRAGAKCWCLPFLRWWHLFRDPCMETPYQNLSELRIRNYLIGFSEIDRPWDEIIKEFAGHLSRQEVLNLQMEFGDTSERWTLLEQLIRRDEREHKRNDNGHQQQIAAGFVPDGDPRTV